MSRGKANYAPVKEALAEAEGRWVKIETRSRYHAKRAYRTISVWPGVAECVLRLTAVYARGGKP